jgi:hypothetical protein
MENSKQNTNTFKTLRSSSSSLHIIHIVVECRGKQQHFFSSCAMYLNNTNISCSLILLIEPRTVCRCKETTEQPNENSMLLSESSTFFSFSYCFTLALSPRSEEQWKKMKTQGSYYFVCFVCTTPSSLINSKPLL